MDKESKTSWPKKADEARLADYTKFDQLYDGEHYDAFKIIGDKDFAKAYNELRYIVGNFPALISDVLADMLFGENFVVDFQDKKNQAWADQFMQDNSFATLLYEAALLSSRRGDVVFKLRLGKRNAEDIYAKNSVILEEVPAWMYFPEFGINNSRNVPTKDVLVWTFKNDTNKTFLHKETHTPGFIEHEIFEYNPDQKTIGVQMPVEQFGFVPKEVTNIKRSLVFFVPNYRSGKGFWGTSDYKGLVQLFFALNNRLTKVDNILDKHSDPILAVPPGVLDEDGKVKKEALGMFEVDNETPGFNKPEYIVWNANLESAEKEIDKLIESLFLFSSVAPATMGMDKNGIAESGRALKFRLLATIRKRNKKMRYFDQAIKDIFETAQEFAIANKGMLEKVEITKAERPKLDWSDGVVNDETEMIDNQVKRIDAGLSSRADAIAGLDGISPDEAKKKVKEIDEEKAVDLPLGGEGGAFAGDKPVPPPNGQKPPAGGQQGTQGNQQQPKPPTPAGK